jgi:esterase/lipase
MGIVQNILKRLETISPYVAAKITFLMFCRAKTTPLRQLEMNIMNQAKKNILQVRNIKVATYAWGDQGKTILLVHGWESRASRFYLFVQELLKNGYRVVAFDAPGHGESQGRTTTILDYQEIMQQLQETYGMFEAIIAHSLGVLNSFYAIKNGVKTKHLVAISGVCDFNYLTHTYSSRLNLSSKTHHHLKKRVENLFLPRKDIWTKFSANSDPERLNCNICIIHDQDDEAVNVEQSKLLYSSYTNKSKIYFTNTLGHLRILNDQDVINLSLKYISQ